MVQIKTLQRENSKKLKSISETRRTALLPSGKQLKQGGKTQSLMITNLINGASLTRKKKKKRDAVKHGESSSVYGKKERKKRADKKDKRKSGRQKFEELHHDWR